jgi:ribA/ribD-fused uncharacterized protein
MDFSKRFAWGVVILRPEDTQATNLPQIVQAVHLVEPQYEIINGDMMVTGALPSSGGVLALHRRTCAQPEHVPAMSMSLPLGKSSTSSTKQCLNAVAALDSTIPARGGSCAASSDANALDVSGRQSGLSERIEFYKAWDEWGALSNFSPHPIDMPRDFEQRDDSCALCRWPSVEHFYQAQKFMHPTGHIDPGLMVRAAEVVDAILAAPSPEEAAREGRQQERCCPELVRSDWSSVKLDVMHAALRAKFCRHTDPRQMLLRTAVGADTMLVEASPHDFFWGCGWDGTGQNMLGRLLMSVRQELIATQT